MADTPILLREQQYHQIKAVLARLRMDASAKVVFLVDKDGQEIRTYSTDAKENNAKLDLSKGMNRFVWDLRYPEADRIEGMILWNGVPGGILAPPGKYFAKIKTGKDSVEIPFTVKTNPNYKISQEEYDQQFSFLKKMKQEKFRRKIEFFQQ